MSKNKKQGYYINSNKHTDTKHAYGRKCVYCGRELANEKAKFYAHVHTREFPVCSEECKGKTEEYVAKDKKFKWFFYMGLIICAVVILIGALLGGKPQIVYPGITIGGLAIFFFPYPISSFETFLGTSIKRVTGITKTLGLVFILIGIFFLIALTR